MIYTGNALKEISFPLGGIGTGSIGLAGNGSLIDFEIFNRPNKGGDNGYTFLAVRAQSSDGKISAKALTGDVLKDLTGQYSMKYYSGFGYGPRSSSMQGFPHFSKVTFDGKFPIARVTFEDDDFPGKIILTAFNPMIPLDEDASSLPAAFFDIAIENGSEDAEYTAVFACTNACEGSVNAECRMDGGAGVFMKGKKYPLLHENYGDITLTCVGGNAFSRPYWYRGGWQDGIATFWKEFTENSFRSRVYSEPGSGDVGTVGFRKKLSAGECAGGRFLLSWYVPNNYNYWNPLTDENGKNITWKNYYAVLYQSSLEVSEYAIRSWDSLYQRTELFAQALHDQSLPECVIDACSSTLSVLKSPTVLRLEDGSFYGWEGVHEKAGSCEGTCTHVWSYQYALSFLFPGLERSLRMNEFKYSTDENGAMNFRMPLPAGRAADARMCVDGQMASVFKTLREWKLSGDDEWLKSVWPKVKKVLSYAWSDANADRWDECRTGILTGRQHHTLDMELFGPSAWLEGMYLAALRAAAEMAEYLGEEEQASEYRRIFDAGYAYVKDNLFNGEYFTQKIDLTDKSILKKFGAEHYWNEEANEIK